MAFNLAGSRGSTIAEALQASRLAREKAESTMSPVIAGQASKTAVEGADPPRDREFYDATRDRKNAPHFRDFLDRFAVGPGGQQSRPVA